MYDRCVNIGVIGSPSVGKSALTVRYLTRRFIGEYCSLKDQTYYNHTTIDGKIVKQHIIDCCKNTLGARLKKLIEWSDGLMVVFSLSDIASFYVAATLLRNLAQQEGAPPFILVANKTDLFHTRCFDYRWGMETAAQRSCSYLEVSAAGGWREVELAFASLTRLAFVCKSRNLSVKPILGILIQWCRKKVKYNKQNDFSKNYGKGFAQSC